MLQATSATVAWDTAKKHWRIRIRIGAEVINRHAPKKTASADELALRSLAIETARAEGYELDPDRVTIEK
jgi:hypothetical protein